MKAISDSAAGKIFSCASLVLAGLALPSLFYPGWPFPCVFVGVAAVGCGVSGLVVSTTANKKGPDRPVSRLYHVIACVGILLGLFYASVVGPLIVFFPHI